MVVVAVAALGACTKPVVAPPPPAPQLSPAERAGLGQPRADLSPEQRQAFERGKHLFQKTYTPAEGLGPQFNQTACSSCHDQPNLGGGSDMGKKVLVVFDPPTFEGTLGQITLPGFEAPVPSAKAIKVFNRPPPLYGIGLFGQIPEAELRASCDPQDQDGDGVAGHLNRQTEPVVGRFGFRGHAQTLQKFVGNALQGEMGIANMGTDCSVTQVDGDKIPDPEVPFSVVEDLVAYVGGLAPPAREGDHPAGRAVFDAIGCAACHRPQTAKGIAAFTDLCVHHMGPGFDTKAKDIEALGDEFRSAPLWGLRFRKAYFHDDRASELGQALEMHGGEAAGAAARYQALPVQQRADLLKFLRTL